MWGRDAKWQNPEGFDMLSHDGPQLDIDMPTARVYHEKDEPLESITFKNLASCLRLTDMHSSKNYNLKIYLLYMIPYLFIVV